VRGHGGAAAGTVRVQGAALASRHWHRRAARPREVPAGSSASGRRIAYCCCCCGEGRRSRRRGLSAADPPPFPPSKRRTPAAPPSPTPPGPPLGPGRRPCQWVRASRPPADHLRPWARLAAFSWTRIPECPNLTPETPAFLSLSEGCSLSSSSAGAPQTVPGGRRPVPGGPAALTARHGMEALSPLNARLPGRGRD
jgi:hypothetical protein